MLQHGADLRSLQTLLGHENLMVVTNNMNVANIIGQNANFRVIVTGGVLRRSDGGLIGELAVQTIQQFKFDIGIIGCSALDPDGDILDYDLQEVGVSQAILNHSRRRILVADHSKFRRRAPARITRLSEIDTFYTDLPVPTSLQAKCREWNTDLRVCDSSTKGDEAD